MKRLFGFCLGMVLLIALASPGFASGFNVTIKPLGGLGDGDLLGTMATEVGFEVFPNVEVVVGIDYTKLSWRFDDGEEVEKDSLSAALYNIGGRYYLMSDGNLDAFAFGNIGFANFNYPDFIKDLSDEDDFQVRIYRLGFGAAYNIAENWAVVGETGLGWIDARYNDSYQYYPYESETPVTAEMELEGALTRTFTSVGFKYSF